MGIINMNKLIIFSLDQVNSKKSEREYSSVLTRLLDFGLDINHVEIGLGSYTYQGDTNPTQEKNIVIHYNTLSDELLDEINSIAFKLYGQESILVIDKESKGYLTHPSKYNEMIGVFTRVNKKEALSNIGFTRIGKKYFVLK